MKIKTKIIILMSAVLMPAVISLVFPVGKCRAAAEETGSAGSNIITLQEFIRDVCRRDLTFQEILMDNLKLAYYKDLNLVSGDILLSVMSRYNFLLNDSDNNGHITSVSLSRLFPASGTEVSASFDSSPNSMRGRTSAFTGAVSQPIAQNAFGYINRLNERIQELDIELAKHQIVEAYEDYLASLIVLYYQWYSDYSNLKTADSALEESIRLLRNIKAKKRFNVAYQSDVDKIDLQVIEKQENLYTLREEYSNTFELICQAAHYKKEKELIPEFSSYYEKEPDFNSEFSAFKNAGRTFNMLSVIEQKGSIEVKRNANALLPSVNLLFGYSKEKATGLSADTEDSLYAGVSLDFPFRQQKNRAAYNISKIEEKKTALSSENTRQKLRTDLKNIYTQIQLEKKLILSADRKIQLGTRIVKSETKDYQLARIQLSELIKSINDLESYKNKKVYHTVKLHTLRIEWLRLLDKLVSMEDTGIK
ncbi:MAG: TolC family protein [Spirochaetes bacterium]|nr:TolC family protein [Spirochaetota bacterium]